MEIKIVNTNVADLKEGDTFVLESLAYVLVPKNPEEKSTGTFVVQQMPHVTFHKVEEIVPVAKGTKVSLTYLNSTTQANETALLKADDVVAAYTPVEQEAA